MQTDIINDNPRNSQESDLIRSKMSLLDIEAKRVGVILYNKLNFYRLGNVY